MAESITPQDLENVKEDIEDIGQSSNERMIINPRYGAPYKSIPLLSDELQAAIEAAAAAGAGANGWTASLVQDSSGKTQQQINDGLNGISFAPDLPPNRRLQIIAGSVRNTGDGWKWISDSAHTPVGITPTVSVVGTAIRINYGFTAKRVVTLVATPDETFAALGFIIGGSVGTTYTDLQIKAPLSFTVDTSTNTITAPAYVAGAISATTASGVCTVTHPTVGATGDAPIVSNISANTPTHTGLTLSYSATQSILHGVGDMDGQIIYNGTAWAYSGELKTAPTMTWVTGGSDAYLQVIHLQTDVFNISAISKTVYDAKVISTSGTEFRVRFYDAAGVLKLTPDNNMQFLFSRRANLPKNVIRGSFAVKRGFAGLLPNDLVSTSGNIWIYGLMEVDS